MKISKFENIIKHNIEKMEEARTCVDRFYSLLGMEEGSEIMNFTQVARSLFWARNYLIVQIPLKDKEIGALCYQGEYDGGYIIINSSLPRYNVNFALGHEICHVCINNDMKQNHVELYVDSTYNDHEEERIANQFAGMILMPEKSFRRMYEKFSSEVGITDNSGVETVICRLMCYFKTPYMAVVIRLCELGLLDYMSLDRNILNETIERTKKIYDENWLDLEELKPTYNDDYRRLMSLVRDTGDINVACGFMREQDLIETLHNLERLYRGLKEDN